TPPLAHRVDELTRGGIQDRLPELPLILALGLDGIEEGLVLTGGVGATLDAQLVEGLDEAETRRSNTDGADQAGLVGKDLISRRRYIRGTGCPHIGDHRIYRNIRMQVAQPADLVVDITSLHRAAARAADAQHRRPGLLVRARTPQTGHQLVSTRLLAIGDGSPHLDQRSMELVSNGTRPLQLTQGRNQRQHADQIEKSQTLEEDPPAARPALLLNRGQQGFLQQLPRSEEHTSELQSRE